MSAGRADWEIDPADEVEDPVDYELEEARQRVNEILERRQDAAFQQAEKHWNAGDQDGWWEALRAGGLLDG